MTDLFRQLFKNQYEAGLCTLYLCTTQCPDSYWQQPVVRYPFSQVVYHTLFFADYYMGADAESFSTQSFHRDHAEWFADYEQLQDREPTSTYERPAILEYLDHCRAKADRIVSAESAESLAGPSGFARRDFSRAELHVYNIRHIQHHAAQLSLKLRADTNVDIKWVGSQWQP